MIMKFNLALALFNGITAALMVTSAMVLTILLRQTVKNPFFLIMNVSHFFVSVAVFGLTCIIFVSRVNINSVSYKITGFSEVPITEKDKRQVVFGERNHSKTNQSRDFCRLCTDYR